MRQWHRWLGICFAVFTLVIALTGVAVQVLDTVATREPKPAVAGPGARGTAGGADDRAAIPAADGAAGEPHHHKHADAAVAPTNGAAAATDAAAAPKPKKTAGLRAWSHWIKDIHSGAMFGPIGTVLSIASGLALMFFSVSGVWMYWKMFTQRKSAGRGAFFWKR